MYLTVMVFVVDGQSNRCMGVWELCNVFIAFIMSGL